MIKRPQRAKVYGNYTTRLKDKTKRGKRQTYRPSNTREIVPKINPYKRVIHPVKSTSPKKNRTLKRRISIARKSELS